MTCHVILIMLTCLLKHSVIDFKNMYLTIIPQARMGSESLAHEAEGWSEWAIDSEAMRERGTIV